MDSVRVIRDSTVIINRVPTGLPGTPGTQWITIPVPAQGEVILRYGMPPRAGGTDSIIVRHDTVSKTAAAGDVAAELREIERRLTARIDALQQQQRPAAVPNVTVIAPAAQGATRTVEVDRNAVPVFQRLQRVRGADLRPYAGVGVDGGDVQFIIGSRADLGPIRANSGWHFMPELAVGIGEGDMSVLAFANAQYGFGAVGGMPALRPYVTLGGGIFSPSVLGINTAVGSSYALSSAVDKPLFLNVELQSINLLNQTRILVGLSRSR